MPQKLAHGQISAKSYAPIKTGDEKLNSRWIAWDAILEFQIRREQKRIGKWPKKRIIVLEIIIVIEILLEKV